ncbi:polymorphic toxin type 8 domain-containing protein [Chryseobacterium flavum]|uniref:polymorphic toxin type 8 domain-containing protein n=1 Tax=Chryseobacterium flavum TaxID=415851 RepID=UPI003A522DC3
MRQVFINCVESQVTGEVLKAEALSKAGRSGKQARLKELGDDPKVSSFNRGWIKNEIRQIRNGNRKTIRNPRNSRNSKSRGTELAHPRGKRAKDGNSYKDAKLQDADLHKLEHKYGGYK